MLWLTSLVGLRKGKSGRRPAAPRRQRRTRGVQLCLESLEDRVVPSAPGTLDSSFGSGGIVLTANSQGLQDAPAVQVQSNGQVVVAGEAVGSNKTGWDFRLARYNANGTLDTSFGSGGQVTTDFNRLADMAYGLSTQADGKYVVVGKTNQGSGNTVDYNFAIARYNANGTLDTTFGSGGKVTLSFGKGEDSARSVLVEPDGSILVAGYAIENNAYNFALAHYSATGQLLGTTLTPIGQLEPPSGPWNSPYVKAALQTVTDPNTGLSTTYVVVAGSSKSSATNDKDFAVARYQLNGQLDSTFGTAGVVKTRVSQYDDVASGLAIQADGKIVVAGSTDTGYTPNKTAYNIAVVRYNPDGTLDSTFGTVGIVTTVNSGLFQHAYADDVAIQPDGKIDIVGYNNGNSLVGRFNADGSVDTTFGANGFVTDAVTSGGSEATTMALYNGKIYTAGWGYTGSTTDLALMRLFE